MSNTIQHEVLRILPSASADGGMARSAITEPRPAIPFDLANSLRLDKTKLYVFGAGIFTGITTVLYPVSLVKTRMQVASKNYAQKTAFDVVRNILKAEGIQGLYRGFGVVITFTVPARIIFLTSFETTKITAIKMVEQFKLSEPVQAALANGLGGMAASISSQAIFVPIDVSKPFSTPSMTINYNVHQNPLRHHIHTTEPPPAHILHCHPRPYMILEWKVFMN
ncbi:hypothetical protein KSP40_PGU019975 [Platanthera guangdongensis]|uniref:Uncharacterized protein n=1 Tax=Platanthera guangdongensis TaxID=2320717 RepID=A0ABR2MZG2_9ASPA